MTGAIEKRIEEFRKNEELQARFRQSVLTATMEDLIHPATNPGNFQREFLVSKGREKVPYPLEEPELQSQYVAMKVDSILHGEESSHPGLVYYQLTVYESELRRRMEQELSRLKPGKGKRAAAGSTAKGRPEPADKRGAPRGAKGKEELSETEREFRSIESKYGRIFRMIHAMKRKLPAGRELKRAKTEEEMFRILVRDFQSVSRDYAIARKAMDALESDLHLYRDPAALGDGQKKTMQELIQENSDLKAMLRRETVRGDTLESEVARLAEQIIASPSLFRPEHKEEVDTLRREYDLLSHKYDALVSKNIELVNRLHKVETAKSLEEVLDNVRDRINAVLRAGVERGEDILLRNIQNEILQIQRARIYLGRALYDLGLLFLRIGDKRSAITEFRAARELGIEDPEINRIINSY